jgi:hypothetical protein
MQNLASALRLGSSVDDAPNTDLRNYILDPLSTIIKLSILANKPVGTKISIQNNTIVFQEPGPFQSLCRVIYQSTKSDIQYLYNPIQLACATFLGKTVEANANKDAKTGEANKKQTRVKSLFVNAQKGLEKMMETYKHCSIIKMCLNYYYALIANYVDEHYNNALFRKDGFSIFYTDVIVKELSEKWTAERTKVVLDIIGFLNHDVLLAENNVRSLETIMISIDAATRDTLAKL